jgi:hypothetical protein
MFVMRWTCLSLMAIRPKLSDDGPRMVHYWARETTYGFARLDETGDGDALAVVQKIDETFVRATFC